MTDLIPVYQPCLDGNEQQYVLRCLASSWISSRGEFIPRFEQAFASYIGAEHATSVSNGTVALHLALKALGIGPGDEVIVPTLTYIASVNAILQAGASVVYADACADTWNLDVDDVRRRLSPRTRAVMAVHLYGLPCDMPALSALCRERQLLLIEDCAEAFGSRCHGRHVGTFGDVATFSFFGNKTITTGEGGMVVCRDAAVHRRACHLKSQGVSPLREYWHDELAYNYRMTNICAAIGVAQLERADVTLARKRQLAAHYRAALAGLPLSMQPEPHGMVHSYWMCSVLLDDAALREPLRRHLKNAGIDSRPLFPPAHTMPHCFSAERFVQAERLSARGINLPSYPALDAGQVARVCGQIRQFLS